MTPVAAAVAGVVLSGAAMFALGARSAQVDAFVQPDAVTLEGQLARAQSGGQAQADAIAAPFRPTVPVSASRPSRRDGERRERVEAVRERERRREKQDDERSWQKTALIIGGSAASGAGVGAIVDGKKGALIGAAIGGGAASIYEATRR